MPKKILVIDDNQGDQVLLREAIADAQLEVDFVTADTGELGIEKVKEAQPDVVVTDTMLPGIDGFEVCRRIKALEGVSVKVIIVTGVIDAVNARSAKQAGCDDYVMKTSSCDQTIAAIKKLL